MFSFYFISRDVELLPRPYRSKIYLTPAQYAYGLKKFLANIFLTRKHCFENIHPNYPTGR